MKGRFGCLSKLLHRKVSIKEVYALKNNKLRSPQSDLTLSENKNLKVLANQVKQLKMSVEKLDYSFVPQLIVMLLTIQISMMKNLELLFLKVHYGIAINNSLLE